MIEIRDDFLPYNIFEQLKKDIVYNSSFPWFLNKVLDISTEGSYIGRTNCLDEDNRQFCYLFYKTDQDKLSTRPHMGRELEKVIPLIQNYEFSHNQKYFLLHVKANLNIRTLKNIEHGFHRDHPWNGKTSVFYLNDNDGYTKFQNGQVVKSKANRAVIFDSPELHTGSTPTDVYARYVINLNWVEDGSPQIVADDMPLTQKLIAEKTLNSE
jgi:hypothetical protein